jgi:hypothetical protein
MKYSIDDERIITVTVLYPRDVDEAVDEMIKNGIEFNGWDSDEKSATFYLDYTDCFPLTEVDEEEYKSNKEELEEIANSFMAAISDYVTEM